MKTSWPGAWRAADIPRTRRSRFAARANARWRSSAGARSRSIETGRAGSPTRTGAPRSFQRDGMRSSTTPSSAALEPARRILWTRFAATPILGALVAANRRARSHAAWPRRFQFVRVRALLFVGAKLDVEAGRAATVLVGPDRRCVKGPRSE